MSFCDENIGEGERESIRKEIARLLEVTGAQIDMAMFDGYKAVEVLTGIMSEVGGISLALRKMLDAKEVIEREELEDYVRTLEKSTDMALREFQFYDLLTQRVAHGVNSVDMLSKYLASNQDAGCMENWESFQKTINERFSLESEKKLFELMMSGLPTDEALDKLADSSKAVAVDDVELF